MALELGCWQLEDPFRGSSLISLLPQTLGPSSHVIVADTEAQDLDSIDNFFKSVAMNAIKGSKQLVEQAQTITKSYSDIHSPCHDDGPLTVNGNDHPNEQRPGPGRKRVKFSLKPPPSTSLPTVDFSSIDNIDDPEEYFSTFEQLECAEKELKKLRGEVSSDLQHHQLTTSNKRRPGRPRRTANYKHRFSFNANTAESETLVESQEEPFDRRVLRSPKASVGTEQLVALHSELFDELGTSQAKNTSIILQDTTAEEGVLAAREKNVANLLETAKNVMREGLQIKSTDAGKMSLPEMGNIYLNQHSLSKSTSRELKGAEISPTKLMSPLEGISALHRRRSLNNPLKDVFSVFPGDDAPSSRDSSVHKSMNKVFLSPVNVSGKSKNASTPNDAACPVVEKGITPCFDGEICSAVGEAGRSSSNRIVSVVTKDPSHLQGTDVQLDPLTGDWPNLAFEDQTKKIIEQPSQLHGTYMKTDTCALNGKTSSEGYYGDFELEDNLIASQPNVGVDVATSSCADHSTERSLTRPPGKIIGENRRRSGRNTEYSDSNDILRSQENASVQEKAEDTSAPMDISCAPEATISEDPNLENTHSLPEDNQECQAASEAPLNDERKKKAPPRTRNKKKSTSRQSLAAISCPSAEAIPEDQHLENRLNSLSEENIEVQQTKLGAAQNDERKRKATSRTQNKKKCALRQSLAGAGMTWEDGRRRSSRRRFRPLERWRGERLLYGRIHNSLATVIGVKYVASPGKDALKIESFVPDEYSDLLAQAAVG